MKIPSRQKNFLIVAFVAGLILTTTSIFGLIDQQLNNLFIFFYGIGLPLFILCTNLIVDLNQTKIFLTWFAVSVLIFITSLFSYNYDKFIFNRNETYDRYNAVNRNISDFSTSSLKSFMLFLIAYWLLNKILKKQGLFVINTFKSRKWYHQEANRDISALDLIINIVLFLVITIAGLFGH